MTGANEHTIPLVSVVMPVYNLASFVGKSIDSVLEQTFRDFEFIIVNDGSTDNTSQIVNSYSDKRINFIDNASNNGLVYALNAGIDKARGKYIARIDGDDIALPQRFEKQVRYMEAHPECDALTSIVTLIDDKENDIGVWPADRKNITFRQIRNYLPKDNCLTHPSALIKTGVLKGFRFSASQALAEDYDLWLRMMAERKEIHKLNEVLTLHRILPTSFTRTRRKNGYFKIMRVKRQFVWEQYKKKKVNGFVVKTLFFSFIDMMIGVEKEIKYFFQRIKKRKG